MKFMQKTAFCMAIAVMTGVFVLPAAAAEDVAAQIAAASGKKYSVNTKALGFTAVEGLSSIEADNNGLIYSCIATSDGFALIEDKKCRYPVGRLTGKAIIFDINGKQLTWGDLGDISDEVFYSEYGGTLSVTRGLYTKAGSGQSAVNAEYASIFNSNILQYTTGTFMVNNVAAVLEDISNGNTEVVSGEILIGGAHRLSLINEKGEKILTFSEPIELNSKAFGGDNGYYYGYNYHMDFGYYSDGLLPFYSDRQLGATLNDLIPNTGADKDEVTEDNMMRKSKKYIFSEHEAGYADLTGKIVIPQKFDEVSIFSEGLAWVGIMDSETNQKKYGFIDKTGEYVIEPQYENAGGFSEGLAPVKKDGKWGYIDKTGKFMIEPKYSDWSEYGAKGFKQYNGADFFSNGIAKVAVKNGTEAAKWGYINTKGETILPLEYDDAFGSDGTYFSVGKTVDGAVKYGVVDQNGNTVLPFIFEDVTTPVNGTVYAFYNRELYSFIISKANLESGDLDGDGEIGAEDAQNVLTLYAESVAGNEPRLTDAQKKAADVNGDGTIDVADAQLILLYYVQNTVTGIPTDWSELIAK